MVIFIRKKWEHFCQNVVKNDEWLNFQNGVFNNSSNKIIYLFFHCLELKSWNMIFFEKNLRKTNKEKKK